ncbi:MAG TPA: DUF3267 domain-containing protein [Gemmatimonadales bacterium]
MTARGPGEPVDATMSVFRANLVALAWLPLSGVLALGPFLLIWDGDRLASTAAGLPPLPLGLALLAAGVLLHELLHAAGFLLFGRAPRAAVRIGFQRRTLTPFASCAAPVTASAYRAAGLLPALVLGAVPVAAAWISGSGTLLLWGWLMLALAGGDLAAVWAMRRVPDDALVLDHPTLVGCRVARPADS